MLNTAIIYFLSFLVVFLSFALFYIWKKFQQNERKLTKLDETTFALYKIINLLNREIFRRERIISIIHDENIKLNPSKILMDESIAKISSKSEILVNDESEIGLINARTESKLLSLYKFDLLANSTPIRKAALKERKKNGQYLIWEELKKYWKKGFVNKAIVVLGILLLVVHVLFFTFLLFLKIFKIVYEW